MKKKCLSTFDFNFVDPPIIETLEGGSQHAPSGFEVKLRSTLKECLDSAGKRQSDPLDRIEVAARMSRLLGREITKAHIDGWIALSTPDRRIHVDALKAMCEVISDWTPLEVFVESCGFKLLTPQEAHAAQYGASMLMKEALDNEIKAIKGRINKGQLQHDLHKRLMEDK